MYFDTHAHYDDARFDADRDALLASLPENGVSHVVNPGCDAASSRAAVEIARRHPHVRAAAGIHPEQADRFSPEALREIRELLALPEVVAVGEVGLDYYWPENPSPEIQRACFRAMMELAREYRKPVLVHERKAGEDAMEIVREYPDVTGVFHCFGGSPETALELCRRGWYISFTGVLTFRNARRAPEAAAAVPADRIMIETDAPYMAPEPHRGERSCSLHLPEIAAALGRARGISAEEAALLTEENALRFFRMA